MRTLVLLFVATSVISVVCGLDIGSIPGLERRLGYIKFTRQIKDNILRIFKTKNQNRLPAGLEGILYVSQTNERSEASISPVAGSHRFTGHVTVAFETNQASNVHRTYQAPEFDHGAGGDSWDSKKDISKYRTNGITNLGRLRANISDRDLVAKFVDVNGLDSELKDKLKVRGRNNYSANLWIQEGTTHYKGDITVSYSYI